MAKLGALERADQRAIAAGAEHRGIDDEGVANQVRVARRSCQARPERCHRPVGGGDFGHRLRRAARWPSPMRASRVAPVRRLAATPMVGGSSSPSRPSTAGGDLGHPVGPVGHHRRHLRAQAAARARARGAAAELSRARRLP